MIESNVFYLCHITKKNTHTHKHIQWKGELIFKTKKNFLLFVFYTYTLLRAHSPIYDSVKNMKKKRWWTDRAMWYNNGKIDEQYTSKEKKKNRIGFSLSVFLLLSCVSFPFLCCYCHYYSRVSLLPLSICLTAAYVYPFWCIFKLSFSSVLFFSISYPEDICWTVSFYFVLLLPIYDETNNIIHHR